MKDNPGYGRVFRLCVWTYRPEKRISHLQEMHRPQMAWGHPGKDRLAHLPHGHIENLLVTCRSLRRSFDENNLRGRNDRHVRV